MGSKLKPPVDPGPLPLGHDRGFTEIRRDGAGPWTTRVVSESPEGLGRIETSRRDRKGRGPLYVDPRGGKPARTINPWLHFVAPNRIAWWVAMLFIMGSLHFLYGPLLGLFPKALALGPLNVANLNYVYLYGSFYFTSASYMQLFETLNAKRGPDFFVRGAEREPGFTFMAWEPRHPAYLSCLLQFLGALCFNVNCTAALFPDQSLLAANLDQWLFAVMGSVLFLSSAYLAVVEATHSFFAIQPQSIEWWVVAVNFVGCAGFLVGSALGISLPPASQAPLVLPAAVFNIIGAMGFLGSSYLMIPELFSE